MITAVFGFAVSGTEAMRELAGEQHIADYRSVLVSLATVLGTIIMAASVIVISNAFRISAAERTRQFGVLKSAGATGRQIVHILLYEAAFLLAVAYPTGLAAGLAIQWLGAGIGDALLAPMNKLINNGLSIHMRFVFSWPVILTSVSVSLVTVLLSAWLPAKKAAGIPAIEAIRLTREIQAKGQKLHTSRLVQTVFGFEGTLAAKAIKRSRRSYRAMVAALAISIILFLVCSSLDRQVSMTINQTYLNIEANTLATYTADLSGETSYHTPLNAETAETLTEALREYPDTAIYGVGINDAYTVGVGDIALTDAMIKTLAPEQEAVKAALVTVDRTHYLELCALAGAADGANILINSTRTKTGDKTAEFQPVRFSGQTLTLQDSGTQIEVALDAQLTGVDVPQELAFAAEEDITIVVPDCQTRMYLWFGCSTDVSGYVAHAEDTLRAFFPLPEGMDEYSVFNVTDVAAITDMTRSLTRLIAIFLYGFVAMLSLIGLTSVISAISANVQLRAREFAVLQSVGMTQGGVRRMLALESVMSALKALLYGLPLGSAAMYLTYLALTQNTGYQFVFPWLTLLEAALGVLVIALITTQYAASKLRRGSVMDAIRMGEGV